MPLPRGDRTHFGRIYSTAAVIPESVGKFDDRLWHFAAVHDVPDIIPGAADRQYPAGVQSCRAGVLRSDVIADEARSDDLCRGDG